MIDSKFRNSFQPIFDRIAKIFIMLKIKPSTITIFAFIIGLVSAFLIFLNQYLAALALLWISGLLDVLDGTVARINNQSSKRGAYIDMIFDRMVEAAVILGFYFAFPEFAPAYMLFFVAVIFNFTTFTVAGSLFHNTSLKSMHYDSGLAERTETFIVFSLMLLFTGQIFWILMIFNIIIFITGIIRFFKITKYSKGI